MSFIYKLYRYSVFEHVEHHMCVFCVLIQICISYSCKNYIYCSPFHYYIIAHCRCLLYILPFKTMAVFFCVLFQFQDSRTPNPDLYGLIPRSFQYMFQMMRSRPTAGYRITASYLEIYNEQVGL